MRTQGIALGLALSIGGLILEPAVAQEYRGTSQQQMACTPDVWRLCSDQIPDVGRIVACLQRNTPQLSRGCRAVFESDVTSSARGPNGRMARSRPYGAPPPSYGMQPGPSYGMQPWPPPAPYYDEEY